jgi:hypothetical protein
MGLSSRFGSNSDGAHTGSLTGSLSADVQGHAYAWLTQACTGSIVAKGVCDCVSVCVCVCVCLSVCVCVCVCVHVCVCVCVCV